MIVWRSMLCDRCHKEEASVHVTQDVNGHVRKLHICEACAKDLGVSQPQGMNLNDMLESLKSQFEALQESLPGGAEAEDVRCPLCNTSRSSILKRGRMGCDFCYERFETEIMPIILSLHHQDQHIGKIPKGEEQRIHQSLKLMRLRRELEEAVEQEDYELAARLRDEIRELPITEEAP